MMIGPSAPNGPPEPMEMAAERGFRIAKRGLDATAIHQDGLDRFGDAVSSNLFGSIARHQSDDERPDDRNSDCISAEVITNRRSKRGAESLIVENICEKADQLQQKQCDECGNHADHDSQQHDRDDTHGRRKVAEILQGGLLPAGSRRQTHRDSFPAH